MHKSKSSVCNKANYKFGEVMKSSIHLALAMLIYSASTISMKYAAMQVPFSLLFFGLYALALVFLLLYAIVWQNLLKKFDLSKAYASKGLTIVYGLLAGSLLFGETIGLKRILASSIVIVGVYMVISDEH